MRKTRMYNDSIPFVQAHHVGRRQRPTSVLLRTSFTTGDKGAALGIANAWTNPYNKMDSCHYVIDEARTYRCVPDKIEAMPTRIPSKVHGTISVNLCYDPPAGPSKEVLYRSTLLVARLCKCYRIKPRILSETEMDKWMDHKWRSRGGIILHTVGDFPVDKFLDSVLDNFQTL
jgi:hypothetical protein